MRSLHTDVITFTARRTQSTCEAGSEPAPTTHIAPSNSINRRYQHRNRQTGIINALMRTDRMPISSLEAAVVSVIS